MRALITDVTGGSEATGRSGGSGGNVVSMSEITPATAFPTDVTTPSMSSVTAATRSPGIDEGGPADGTGAVAGARRPEPAPAFAPQQ
jgi:hypothetical protein